MWRSSMILHIEDRQYVLPSLQLTKNYYFNSLFIADMVFVDHHSFIWSTQFIYKLYALIIAGIMSFFPIHYHFTSAPVQYSKYENKT